MRNRTTNRNRRPWIVSDFSAGAVDTLALLTMLSSSVYLDVRNICVYRGLGVSRWCSQHEFLAGNVIGDRHVQWNTRDAFESRGERFYIWTSFNILTLYLCACIRCAQRLADEHSRSILRSEWIIDRITTFPISILNYVPHHRLNKIQRNIMNVPVVEQII